MPITKTLVFMLMIAVMSSCKPPSPPLVSRPTLTVSPTITLDLPAPTVTPSPFPTISAHVVVPAPPGIVYKVGEELWQVAAEGTSQPFVPLSASEEFRYFVKCEAVSNYQCDIWVEGLQSGTYKNITQTSERHETYLLSPTSIAERLFFCSAPVEVDGVGIHCQLTSIRTDGTEYTVLTDWLFSYPVLSPDKHTIAYIASSAPGAWDPCLWLFPLDGVPQLIEWTDYGLDEGQFGMNPVSWSPDNSRLAGWAWGQKAGMSFSGIAILDLATGNARLLPDLHYPIYFDGYPPAPLWSSNGEWLTFLGVTKDSQLYGIWVVSTNREEVHILAQFESGGAWEYNQRAWSPDGQWLALTRHIDDSEQGVWVVKVGEWELYPTDLPQSAEVIAWIDLEN